MRFAALAFTLVLPLATRADESDEQLIVWPDAAAVSEAERLRDKVSLSEEVVLGVLISDSQLIKIRFGISTKGNGTVSLPGLTVRVYDMHADGSTFRGGLLKCEWHREGDYPYLDFVVTGMAVRYDEKGDAEIGEVPVKGVFRYSAAERRFYPISCSEEIDFWSSDL